MALQNTRKTHDVKNQRLSAWQKMPFFAKNTVAKTRETWGIALLRRHLKKEDDARALIRELFVSSGDIEPNTQTNTLTIRIHRMANPVHDRAIAALLEELNSQEFAHPETGAKMTFALV
jgi:hypothetical protein